jgi:hypothetical protein
VLNVTNKPLMMSIALLSGRHDTQHNDTHYYETKHANIQHNDTQQGRLSKIDLLELASLDQILFIMKILFTFYKIRSIVLSLPPSVNIPCTQHERFVCDMSLC